MATSNSVCESVLFCQSSIGAGLALSYVPSYLLNYCALGNNWPTCRNCCLKQRKAVVHVTSVFRVQCKSFLFRSMHHGPLFTSVFFYCFYFIVLIFRPLEQFFNGADIFSGHYAQFSLIFCKIIYSVPDTASRNTTL